MSPLKRRNSVKECSIILRLKMTNKTRSKGFKMEPMIGMRKSGAHGKNTETNLWNSSIKTTNRSLKMSCTKAMIYFKKNLNFLKYLLRRRFS